MGVFSLLLAFVAGFLCLLGFLTALIPVVGTVLAFSAPVAALVGVWLGGVAWSRARRAGRGVELPVVAVVLNTMAFVPAMLVALTCGVCNAMVAGGPVRVQRTFGSNWSSAARDDGGMPFGLPPLAPMGTGDRGPARTDADAGRPAPSASPSAVPPPLPAGPRAPLPPAPRAD